ncbi:hypothetical protein AB6A40_008911 [Gnathostoma spinigerum]|uniref:C2 domain-containing protein n=1 Tax=Gnathostoma spinigerum TaxID=75299 RepID=A0ABD6EZJ3_9BILA
MIEYLLKFPFLKDGVTVELYRPCGGSYELCASGLISLREFLSPKQPLVIFGTLSLKSVNDGQQFAVLDYEVTLKSELATALQAQKRRITAASFLSLTNSAVEYDQSMYNTLIIDVHKCNNLNSLLSKSSTAAIPLSTYVVYQLYDFHPFLTNVVSNNSNPGYYSSKAWILPLGNELQRYLRTTELTFIVMSDSDGVNNDEKVNRLGIVNVPLYPLSNNKRISGTFPLTSAATNEVSDATIDISLYWKYLYEAFDEHIETAKVMDYVDVNEENESSTSKEPSSTSSSAKQSSEGVSTKEEQISLATRSESRFRPESRRMIENSFEVADSKSDRTSHSEVISSNLIEDSENRGAEGDKKLMDTGRKMERSHEAQKGHITKVEGPATKVITVVPSERKKPATNNEVVDDIDDLPALNSPSSSGSSFITEMTPKVNDPSLLDYDKMITVETNSTVGNNDDEKSEKNVKSTKNERSHEENGKNANESMTVERNGESAESVSDKSDITVESVGDGNPTESVTAVGVSEGVKIEPPETSKTTEEFEKTIRNEANKDDVVSEVTGKNTHPQAKAKPSIAVAEEKKTLVKQSEVNCESAERVSASVSREEKKKDDRQNGSSSLGLSTLPPIRGSLVSQVAPASESTLDNLQRPSPAPRKPSRVVEFADPIHESISLSESVSYDSSTVSSATGLSDRGRLLEEDLDIPVISAASASQKRLTEESNESSNSLVHSIAISVNFLVLPEHSTLLDPLLSDFKFFIEWKLLDFPLEECETPQSLPLPNIAKRPINIGFKRRYGLNERRQKLLKQWVELGNKLEFTLVSDGGNLKECDDLGVAQLSLHPSNSGTKQLINIFDVNGDELAILEVQVDYSTEMLDVLTSG